MKDGGTKGTPDPGNSMAPMERIEQIFKLAEERDKHLDSWLRWLVALAVGCLAVLIPLSKKCNAPLCEYVFFRCTCVFLVVGVIALSIRIYAFCLGQQARIEALRETMLSPSGKFAVGHIPSWMKRCEVIGYVSLILGVCSLVAFACL